MEYVGFVAKMRDGSEIRECDRTWDDVPNEGITKLSLMSGGVELCSLAAVPDGKFFFYNETVAARHGMGVLSAKAIGMVSGDRVQEFKIDYLPTYEGKPSVTRSYNYPVAKLRIFEKSFRSASCN